MDNITAWIFTLISFCSGAVLRTERVVTLPEADGNLHAWFLPVGQGDATILQCPDGTLSLYDWGSSQNFRPDVGFWAVEELKRFLSGKYGLLKNIIITHQHWDHYKFIPETFDGSEELSAIENIYISCKQENMATNMVRWIEENPQYESLLREFNEGKACGVNDIECGTVYLCPGRPDIYAKILSANLRQNCESGNKNLDSIVAKLVWGEVSMLLTGDFEDATSSWGENGPQKKMVEYYGNELKSTVYMLSHYGASYLANKPIWRDAISPSAIIGTGNTWYQYGHPRCAVIDAFIQYVGTLCKPGDSEGSEDYCGENVYPGDRDVQSVYTCGVSSREAETREDNDFAIYTTTPRENEKNLLQFTTNGDRWGIKVHKV